MKTIQQFNKTFFNAHKSVFSIKCTNGRTYYFYKLNENDYLFSFNSVRTGMRWDDPKVMVYKDFDKFLKALKRIEKMRL